MKFKKAKGADVSSLHITDKYDDVLSVYVSALGTKDGVFFDINDANVKVTRAKALKLAWAIIEELDPSVL